MSAVNPTPVMNTATELMSTSCSDPLQRALFPDPDVANHQDGEKDHHLDKAEEPERLELHRPGEQEDGLDIEDNEQDGDDIKPHRVAAARRAFRINAAFVRHQLGLRRMIGT